ncbi:hypothetical protein nbrc107696_08320 [Gordonia spumicola]|uniref:Uncharacterized protein n=1 Tax=Gordonia spumicola TaxID=589161 RepID=A0A7I9V4Q4_9ACTN|nr:hypothetical protein [Gordonia spumicola]GEE00386.1 hypothetical protein nbrc107696_08320 [Gordonia spumicola]
MSEYEFVDEGGNPIDPAQLEDGEYEVVDEVESDEPDEVDYLADLLLEDDEVPDLDLDGGQPSPAPAVVDDDQSEEVVEIIEIDEPATAAPSLVKTSESEPVATAPVEPEETPGISLNGKGKLVLVSAAAAVAVVVGGLAFGLSALGNENTAADVADYGRGKASQASEAVVSKSSEVRGEAAAVAIDACRVGKLSGPGGLGDAMSDGSETPKLKLDVISASPLPGAFIKARTNADGVEGTPSVLQLAKTGWGVYVTVPLTKAEKKNDVSRPGFWKADIAVSGDKLAVTGDRAWAGGDTGGAGSCEPAEPGVYAASGNVPADAAGLVDGTASVDAIQGVAGRPDTAVAIMGNSITLVRLVEAPAEGGDAASSSSKPSK